MILPYDAINGKPQQFPVTAEESPYFGVSLGGKMNHPEMKVGSNYGEKLNCINATMITHVVASFISLATTFYKSQSKLMPPLLLSKLHPLRWASFWFWVLA